MQLDWKQDEYTRAYLFAAEALNANSFPGTDLPYIVHISLVSMEVMAVLQMEHGLNADLALKCALLHDVIEDAGVTFEDLEATFGTPVAQGVSALSKNPRLEKSLQIQDSLRRIRRQPNEVWMVKMADRISNLLPPPPNWTRQRAEAYRRDAIKIHDSLKSASAYLADRLAAKIEAYQQFLH